MRDIVMVMGAGLIGFSALHLYQRSQKSDVSSLADDKNAAETFHSEMNQDMSAPSGELNRLNPTVVEGAEDIMGAETVGDRNYVFMHPWNDLTPQGTNLIILHFLCQAGWKPCPPTHDIMMEVMLRLTNLTASDSMMLLTIPDRNINSQIIIQFPTILWIRGDPLMTKLIPLFKER